MTKKPIAVATSSFKFLLIVIFLFVGSFLLLPDLKTNSPGMSILGLSIFVIIVAIGLRVAFKVSFKRVASAVFLTLLLFVGIFAVGQLASFLSWLMNPAFFGVDANIVVDYCSPKGDEHLCYGEMSTAERHRMSGVVEYPHAVSPQTKIEGTYYEDSAYASGYFVPYGTPPKIDPVYSAVVGLSIFIPVGAFVVVFVDRLLKRKRGWFWSIEGSVLNSPTVRWVIVAFGATLMLVSVPIFGILLFNDLKVTDPAALSASKLLGMTAGDFITISGIGLTLVSASDLDGEIVKSPWLRRRISARRLMALAEFQWVASIMVLVMSIFVVALRLTDPTNHNMIPLPLRAQWNEVAPAMAIIGNAFSWSNMLGIIALSSTLGLLGFSRFKQVPNRIGDFSWSHLESLLAQVAANPKSRMEVLKLNQLADDGGVSKGYMLRMKLIKETGRGEVQLTSLGADVLENSGVNRESRE